MKNRWYNLQALPHKSDWAFDLRTSDCTIDAVKREYLVAARAAMRGATDLKWEVYGALYLTIDEKREV